jgi:hypothetical protein
MTVTYQWLVDEMSRIKTRKFHLVDGGPATAELREAITKSDYPLPPSYKDFVLQFGNAKLYRQVVYLVQVFAGPISSLTDMGERFIHFGRTDLSLAYFKESLLVSGSESAVFEWRHGVGIRKAADGFEEWLKAKCSAARRRFKKNEWKAIELGPPPFSSRELEIVDARKKFGWRVVGVAPNGDIQFEVHNGSDVTLPFLSLGVRGKLRPPKNGPLNGGVWLPISAILPGETQVVEKDCYKEVVDPSDIEVFEKPDPEPEDRDRYWEFKSSQI